MQMSITSDLNKAALDFSRLSNEIRYVAFVRGINRGVMKMRTEGAREVSQVYAIKQKVVRDHSTVRKASTASGIVVKAGATWKGSPIGLEEFSPSARNPWNVPGRAHKRRGGGVSVRITKAGGRKVITGAFITFARSGHKLVLQRVSPNDPSVTRSRRARRKNPRGRYPVKHLMSIDIATAVSRDRITDRVTRAGYLEFRKEFGRQLELAFRKVK